MKKKTYIIPAVNIHQLHMADGILLTGSAEERILNEGTGTGDNSITSGDTKGSYDWDIWDE